MLDNLLMTASNFSTWDLCALLVFLAAWAGMGLIIEQENPSRPSTHTLMREFRLQWMETMVTRNPRIFDMVALTSLRQGGSFFASACLIAIGGGVALLGQAERLAGLASDISADLTAPLIVWEAKILLILLVLAYALLKFIWSIRLFGYCAVVMGAVPNDPEHPEAFKIAKRAGKLNIYAARSFNRGLRAIYFALGAIAWLLGPLAFLLAIVLTVWMLYRREFHSLSRSALLEE